jgi:FdhD protein
MRTPGADRELAAGFLFSERVLKVQDDLGAIEYCRDVSASHPENVINVTLTGQSALELESAMATRRQVIGNASCGMCGRLTIDSLAVDCPPIEDAPTIDASLIALMPDRLRGQQAVFAETGGLHGAGLFTAAGQLTDMAEDVGRHNAVDKVVGRMIMREALPLADAVLFVSGRTSFEIVQKAWLAGIPCVASVSAPSSLAIELAERAGMTLIGFVRPGGLNVYTHEHRIRS